MITSTKCNAYVLFAQFKFPMALTKYMYIQQELEVT